MNIWLITSELPEYLSGGIGRYIINYAYALAEAGHKVLILSRMAENCDRKLAKNIRLVGFIPLYEYRNAPNPDGRTSSHPSYPYNVLGYWGGLSFQVAEEIINLLDKEEIPDIIECQEYGGIAYFLLQRKLIEDSPLKNIPIVIFMHGATFDLSEANQTARYKFPEYWIGQMEKFCLLAADSVVAPSNYVINRVEEELHCRLNAICIPLPYQMKEIEPINHIEKNSTDTKALLYVGRLELRKGVLKLLYVCNHLWEQGVTFKLILIGGDTKIDQSARTVGEVIYKKYSHKIEDGSLELLGELPYSEVLCKIKEAWGYIIPSVWENFPNTCIEGMIVGQLMLGSTDGGQAEMIQDGISGFLFDWNKKDDLEEKIVKLLNIDELKRKEMSENARKRIYSICSPEIVIPKRVEHYKNVIANYHELTSFPNINQSNSVTNEIAYPYNDEKDLLSVIIPFYNLGNYVLETLRNVLESDYQNLEVIIVNDGSNDQESVRILSDLEIENNPKVRIISTENQGLALARNVGAKNARGEYIAFIDADDLVANNFFSRAIYVLKKFNNVSFVYSWVQFFDNSEGIWPTWNVEFPYLLGHNMLSAFTVLRKQSYLRSGINDAIFEYGLEDFEGWISMLENGEIGVSLPYPLVFYRIRPQSMLRSISSDQRLYTYERITRKHRELYQKWAIELFNLQNANGPAWLWNHPTLEFDTWKPPYLPEYYSNVGVISTQDYFIGGLLVSKIKNTKLFMFMRKSSLIMRIIKRFLNE